MKKRLLIPLLILQVIACATVPEYKPIVDTAAVTDSAKYQKDYQECKTITDSVDYSDEKTRAALKGAAIRSWSCRSWGSNNISSRRDSLSSSSSTNLWNCRFIWR